MISPRKNDRYFTDNIFNAGSWTLNCILIRISSNFVFDWQQINIVSGNGLSPNRGGERWFYIHRDVPGFSFMNCKVFRWPVSREVSICCVASNVPRWVNLGIWVSKYKSKADPSWTKCPSFRNQRFQMHTRQLRNYMLIRNSPQFCFNETTGNKLTLPQVNSLSPNISQLTFSNTYSWIKKLYFDSKFTAVLL